METRKRGDSRETKEGKREENIWADEGKCLV